MNSWEKRVQSFNHRFEMIAIGASAGGMEALDTLIPLIPPSIGIPIVVVQHLAPNSKSLLSSIYQKRTQITVKEADEKELIRRNHLYFAPPNYHLLVSQERLFALTVEEPVQYARPSIDVFFDSASQVYWNQLLGIILSGANHDGAQGLRLIRARGGMGIVQSPQTALIETMPQAAIEVAKPELILSPTEIGQFISAIANGSEKGYIHA